MEANSVYTATLRFSTTGADPTATHIHLEWDPPFENALQEVGADPYKLPPAYQHMAHLFQTAILPRVAMNEAYETEFLDEPSVADVLDELNAGDSVH